MIGAARHDDDRYRRRMVGRRIEIPRLTEERYPLVVGERTRVPLRVFDPEPVPHKIPRDGRRIGGRRHESERSAGIDGDRLLSACPRLAGSGNGDRLFARDRIPIEERCRIEARRDDDHARLDEIRASETAKTARSARSSSTECPDRRSPRRDCRTDPRSSPGSRRFRRPRETSAAK